MEQLEMDGKLIDALQWGREDAVVEWLAQGASPNAVDTGNTAADRALHKASRRRGSPSLRNLLMAGAEVDMRSGTGATALHTAALSGHAPHITTLLRHGADATLTLENGSTPLHYGASCKNVETLQALLLGGAELDATNDEGNTALDVASKRGSEHQLRMRDAAKALGESIVPAALPDTLPAKADLLAATPEQQGQFNLHNIGFGSNSARCWTGCSKRARRFPLRICSCQSKTATRICWIMPAVSSPRNKCWQPWASGVSV